MRKGPVAAVFNVVIRLRAWADDRARTYCWRSVCSAWGSHNPAQSMDFTDRSTRGWAGSICCLICTVAKLSIALLFCLTLLLRIGQKPRSRREMHCKATLWILLVLSPSSSFPSVNAYKGAGLISLPPLVFCRPFTLGRRCSDCR